MIHKIARIKHIETAIFNCLLDTVVFYDILIVVYE